MTTRTEAIARIIDPENRSWQASRNKARAIEALLGLDEVENALRSIVFYEADDFPERGDICEHYFPRLSPSHTLMSR